MSYNVTDANGNAATEVTRTVNIVAGDIPVISLTGSGTINHEVNTPYADDGATASDSEDGNITSSIVINNTVNTSATGSYIISYDVVDSSDNPAIQVTRTVNVQDTTPPIINLSGSATVSVFKNQVYSDLGATYIDNFDAT